MINFCSIFGKVMKFFILSGIILFIVFVPTEQQGRRAPSSAPSAQSAQQRRGPSAQPQPTPATLSKGQPKPAKDDDEDDDDETETEKFDCPKADGLFPDPNNCKKFFLCGSWRSWAQSCPPSLYFDGKLKFCTFKTAQLTCGPVDEEIVRQEEAERNQDNLLVCDPSACQLPNCFCSADGSRIPGDIPVEQTPQMVLINFSGAVNELIYEQYKKVLGYTSKYNPQQSRLNPNGCGIKATFFINHEYSNYAQILWLAANGHEIGLHTITHRLPEIWWTDKANYSEWAEEVIGMREILLANTGGPNSPITRETLVGMRAPYIKPGGDNMFEMAHDFGLLYDSSVVAPRGSPPYWPFSFDYRQPFDCSNNSEKKNKDSTEKSADGDEILDTPLRQSRGRQKRDTKASNKLNRKKASLSEKKLNKSGAKSRIRRNSPFLGRPLKCPTKAYPGLWEVPINPLWDEYNTCHHADQCVFPNRGDNEVDDIFTFLKENFDRHYTTNRAPFQLNFHVTWFTQKAHTRALIKFLDYIVNNHKDAWFVTFQQMISWIKDPQPLTQLNFKCENSTSYPVCNRPHTCVLKHYLDKDNTATTDDASVRTDTRYMPVCNANACPQQFQWYGNYAGKKRDFKTIMQLVEEAVGPDQGK